ncbi:MAG: hypothetical protein M3386_00455 [Actinomycetota bacterium]|nr:hypothetical protein [Actinomycetota bacterium]
MTPPRPAGAAVAIAAGLAASLLLTACTGDDRLTAQPGSATGSTEETPKPPEPGDGGTGSTEPPADDDATTEPAPDVGCSKDVTETKIPAELSNLSYPDRTVVYRVEVLGENGVRVIGVTDLAYHVAREQMRRSYSRSPFDIVDEDRGVTAFGANWTGPSITGRWVVSNISEVCPGDTEVEILWTADG